MLVRVSHLWYAYPEGAQALADVSFAIDEGECVGLIGPNGAGKSTLLLHLNGLLPERGRNGHVHTGAGQGTGAPVAHAGEVCVGEWKVAKEHLADVRRAVGLVFQDPDDQLFCPTVREDVAFGPINLGLAREEVVRRVNDSLAAVGLSNAADRYPHHLSFGERKRACLAGVLACEPRLLALDEPTANLDPRARRQLIGVLAELPCARLIASHDLEMILELCDRAILLDGGRVQADGPTSALLADDALLAAHGLERPPSLR